MDEQELLALIRRVAEEEWEELGLHGLSDRLRKKRIEALFTERMRERREIGSALRSLDLLAMSNPGGFAGEIYETLTGQDVLPATTGGAEAAAEEPPEKPPEPAGDTEEAPA